jgi:ABC-2 type transport system permease protein
MDRFLVSPVSRVALVAASVAQSVVVILIQTLIIIGVAAALGASFSVQGVVLLLALAALLGGAICALSDGLTLVTRQETLIGAVQFVVLPATFLSSAMMAMNLAPGWISGAARFNPVNWSLVGVRAALLAALLAASFWLAGRAFGAYQRSV